MAIAWSQRNGEDFHEIRTAGKSVRLYTNGVFHSQWNPHNLLTRSVWDSMTVAGFFLKKPQLRRVLVLGVGGGVVIKQLRTLFPDISVVGVELNPIHIEVAHRWFEIDDDDATLVHADAQQWLQDYEGPTFDLIIDDLFGDAGGEVARAVPVDKLWATQLCKHLDRDHGVLAVNFVGNAELKQSELIQFKQFKTRQRFTPPCCENAVSIFSKTKTHISVWKKRVNENESLSTREKKTIIDYKRQASFLFSFQSFQFSVFSFQFSVQNSKFKIQNSKFKISGFLKPEA